MINIKLNSKLLSGKRQVGRSMIEMLGVLAIMSIITVVSIQAYTSTMRSLKVNQLKTEVALIAAKVRDMNPMGDYSKVQNNYHDAILGENLDIVPRLVKTGYLKNNKNPFGGTYFTLRGSLWDSWNNPRLFTVFARITSGKDFGIISTQDWSGANLMPNGKHYSCYSDKKGGDCSGDFSGWIAFTFK